MLLLTGQAELERNISGSKPRSRRNNRNFNRMAEDQYDSPMGIVRLQMNSREGSAPRGATTHRERSVHERSRASASREQPISPRSDAHGFKAMWKNRHTAQQDRQRNELQNKMRDQGRLGDDSLYEDHEESAMLPQINSGSSKQRFTPHAPGSPRSKIGYPPPEDYDDPALQAALEANAGQNWQEMKTRFHHIRKRNMKVAQALSQVNPLDPNEMGAW